MATQAQMHQWHEAVGDALSALDASERYQSRQRQLRRGRARDEAQARPLEFDPRGFPIPQPVPSFMQRLSRLISDN
jgi:hypothetical protein